MYGNDVMVISLIPFVLLTLIIGTFAHSLGKKKGYSGALFILAWFPILNIYGMLYFIGLPDKILHAKVDSLLGQKGGILS